MINEFYLNKLYKEEGKELFSMYEQQPILIKPVVTQFDVENGYITRYFVKQVNDKTFVVEVDENQYSNFQDNPRFAATKIRWKIVGKKETQYLPNNVSLYGVLDSNRETVANTDLTFDGLQQYIQDYGEFWFAEKI